MIFLGISILGNLNKEATSQKSLGLPFWRVVIASGIVILVMGPINILAVSTHFFVAPEQTLTDLRATYSETRRVISQHVKFDLMAQWPRIRQM